MVRATAIAPESIASFLTLNTNRNCRPMSISGPVGTPVRRCRIQSDREDLVRCDLAWRA